MDTPTSRPLPRFAVSVLSFVLAAGGLWAPAARAGAQVVDEHVTQPQKLSAWMEAAGVGRDHFLPGLMWMVEGARPAQLQQRAALVRALRSRPEISAKLIRTFETQQVTGRLRVEPNALRNGRFGAQDDPGLLPGDRVVVSVRPETVLVLGGRGQWCVVEHVPETGVRPYAKVCREGDDAPGAGDPVWLIQPDGEVQKVRLSRWGQDEPPVLVMPGAWIWAPPQGDVFSEGLNAQIAHWLATQGASGMVPGVDVKRLDGRHPASPVDRPGDAPAPARTEPALAASVPPPRRTAHTATSSDWGTTGLLQTPTARMRPQGTLVAQVQQVRPYTTAQVVVQPLAPLEVGLRVARVAAQDGATVSESVRDLSLDLKLRLWDESRWVPAVAVGARDVAGDARLSGEFVVANKQFGDFDLSAGLGWGYLAGLNGMSNPLSFVGDGWKTRPTRTGSSASGQRFFHGRTRGFAGVKYQPEWAPWSIKVEYDGGAHRLDALGAVMPYRTRLNFGATYQVAEFIELSAGLERGREASLGLTVAVPWGRLFAPTAAVPAQP